MTLWSIEAFFVIPLGALCLLLLLSDIRGLQKIALSLCSVQLSLGFLQVSLSSVFALFSTLVFAFQSFSTLGADKPTILPTHTVEMVDRLRMKEWRNDRNWWIALFACTLWLICWRVQIWTKRYCIVESSPARAVSPKPATLKKRD